MLGRTSNRKVVQDIVPSNRRTIRNVLPERPIKKISRERIEKKIEDEIIYKDEIKKRDEEENEYKNEDRKENKKEKTRGEIREEVEMEVLDQDPETEVVPIRRIHSSIPPQRNPNNKKRNFSGILVAFVVIFIGVAIIAMALSLLYSKAVVTITPKIANFNVSGPFTAQKNAVSPALPYELIISSDTSSQTIQAIDGPLIETKAKGTVVLYNERTVQQKIVAGTRFSNSKGLIYRAISTVVIPPMKVVKGQNVFGTVSVGVMADKSGDAYNMSLADNSILLNIVAYKGSDKYTTIYGKLKTNISGGFSGKKKIISKETEKSTIQSLEQSLESNLSAKLKTLIPKGYLFYNDAYSIEYEILNPISKDKETAEISIRGTVYGVIFKKDSFIKFIAKRELDKFPSPTYEVRGMEALAFSIANEKDFSAKKGNSLAFNLKGPITIVGIFGEDALKNELKGTYLKQSNTIFAHYTAIANAYALITPFWMRSFPNSPDKISIEIKN